jgi:hypothetical protein
MTAREKFTKQIKEKEIKNFLNGDVDMAEEKVMWWGLGDLKGFYSNRVERQFFVFDKEYNFLYILSEKWVYEPNVEELGEMAMPHRQRLHNGYRYPQFLYCRDWQLEAVKEYVALGGNFDSCNHYGYDPETFLKEIAAGKTAHELACIKGGIPEKYFHLVTEETPTSLIKVGIERKGILVSHKADWVYQKMAIAEVGAMTQEEFEAAEETCRAASFHFGKHSVRKGGYKKIEMQIWDVSFYYKHLFLSRLLSEMRNAQYSLIQNAVLVCGEIDNIKIKLTIGVSFYHYIRYNEAYKEFELAYIEELANTPPSKEVEGKICTIKNLKKDEGAFVGNGYAYVNNSFLINKKFQEFGRLDGFWPYNQYLTSAGYIVEIEGLFVLNQENLTSVELVVKKKGHFLYAKFEGKFFVWTVESGFGGHVEGDSLKNAFRNFTDSEFYRQGVNLLDGISLEDVFNKFNYCLAGVKGFLVENMPFIYRQISAYELRKDIPAEVLNVKHFVDTKNKELVKKILKY